MRRLAVVAAAVALWLLAVVGAVGVAYWQKLSFQNGFALVAVVMVVAFFGAFMPVLGIGIKPNPKV